MLSNEKFAVDRRKHYDSIGLVVDHLNGEFAHSPYPKGMGETGYYLLHGDHQHHGLLQSKDLEKCCFFSGDAVRWLTCTELSPDLKSELWSIYEKYKGENARKLHKDRDEEGRSLHNLNLHSKRDESGKSLIALKTCVKIHEEKNESGKSKHAVRMSEKANQEKNDKGQSLASLKGGEIRAQELKKTVELTRVSDKGTFLFESVSIASKVLGVCKSNLAAVCRGTRKTAGGYTARYL
jgi:hypothetical protein